MNDLTLDFDGKVVNIRIVILLETPKGFLFEKSRDGYAFPLGGRIHWGETTLEAAQRELYEEVGIKDIPLKLLGYIENFFEMKEKDWHEFSFVYTAQINDSIEVEKLESELAEDNDGYVLIEKKDLDKKEIRPSAITGMILSNKEFQTCVVRD